MRSRSETVLDSPRLPPGEGDTKTPRGNARSAKGVRVVKLMDRNVRTLPALGGRRTDYTDDFLPGFVLRVSPSGHRSYCVVYGTGPAKRRFTLGSVLNVSLADARVAARKILR